MEKLAARGTELPPRPESKSWTNDPPVRARIAQAQQSAPAGTLWRDPPRAVRLQGNRYRTQQQRRGRAGHMDGPATSEPCFDVQFYWRIRSAVLLTWQQKRSCQTAALRGKDAGARLSGAGASGVSISTTQQRYKNKTTHLPALRQAPTARRTLFPAPARRPVGYQFAGAGAARQQIQLR